MGKNLKKVVQPEPDVQEEGGDEEVALDEDDIEELVLDEDAVPKRKVEIDNTVASLSSPNTMPNLFVYFIFIFNRMPFVEYVRRFNSILHCHGQKRSSSRSQKLSRLTSMMT